MAKSKIQISTNNDIDCIPKNQSRNSEEDPRSSELWIPLLRWSELRNSE